MLTAPFSETHLADPFGDWPQWRKNEGLGPHRGQDWNGLDAGTPIPASGTGTVTWSRWNNVLGWEVVVYYPSDEVYVGYCHLHEEGPGVGTTVKRGNTVGRLGNTGTASYGAHLHMTASRVNGDPGTVPVINPMQFMSFSSTIAGSGDHIIPTSSNPEEDEMKFLYVNDDGAGRAVWVLLNVSTAKFITTYNQAKANGWATVWGNARPTPRQEFLNAIDAIKKTNG